MSAELLEHFGVGTARKVFTESGDYMRLLRCLLLLMLLFLYLVVYQLSIYATMGMHLFVPSMISGFQNNFGAGFWLLGVYMLEINGVKVIVTGDKLEIENSLLVSNHQSFVDYFVFPLLSALLIDDYERQEAGQKHDIETEKAKLKAKKIIRNQFNNESVVAKDFKSMLMPNVNYFTWYKIWKAPNLDLLHRVMMTDENWELSNEVQYNVFTSYKNQTIKSVSEWLVVFPEVNIFNEKNHKLENSMSEKYYLPVFKNLLYPRFSNFANAIGGLQNSQFTRLYDVTILYQRVSDTPEKSKIFLEQEFKAPNLLEILGLYRGKFVIYVHISAKMLKRVPLKRNRLERWLEKKWIKKDKLMESIKEELKKR